jgi:hypothetical protein
LLFSIAIDGSEGSLPNNGESDLEDTTNTPSNLPATVDCSTAGIEEASFDVEDEPELNLHSFELQDALADTPSSQQLEQQNMPMSLNANGKVEQTFDADAFCITDWT